MPDEVTDFSNKLQVDIGLTMTFSFMKSLLVYAIAVVEIVVILKDMF